MCCEGFGRTSSVQACGKRVESLGVIGIGVEGLGPKFLLVGGRVGVKGAKGSRALGFLSQVMLEILHQ